MHCPPTSNAIVFQDFVVILSRLFFHVNFLLLAYIATRYFIEISLGTYINLKKIDIHMVESQNKECFYFCSSLFLCLSWVFSPKHCMYFIAVYMGPIISFYWLLFLPLKATGFSMLILISFYVIECYYINLFYNLFSCTSRKYCTITCK